MQKEFIAGRRSVRGPWLVNTQKVLILLIKKGVKQVDLARQWGVSRSAVSAVILGKAPYSPLLLKLAEALNVPMRSITMPHPQFPGGRV